MSELITVVNEQGLVTGSKERYEVTDNDLCLSIAVWLEDPAGHALIAQRSTNMVVSPNLWSCAVEGMVDYGDDVVGTAHKEVREEMGTQLGLIDLCDKLIHPSSHGQRYKHLFRALFNSLDEIHPAASEVQNIRLVPHDELRDTWQAAPEQFVPHFGQLLDHFIGLDHE